jgi:hypothetical protein
VNQDRSEGKEPRGSLSLFATAFALLAAAAVVFEVTTIGWLQSTRLLWVSSAFSVGALLVAVASVLVPRR